MQVQTIRREIEDATTICKVKNRQMNEDARFKTKKRDEHNTHK
jgi:hypothetical protein